MKKIYSILMATSAVAGFTGMTSCSDDKAFLGTWETVNPMHLEQRIAGFTSIESQQKISFAEGIKKRLGDVKMTSELDVVRNVTTSDGTEIEMTAEGYGFIKGTWTYDLDDDDDLVLNFDYNTLDVKFDKSNITFNGLGATKLNAQERDSLANIVADICTRDVKLALSREFTRYSVIKDVDVSKDGNTLGFEISSPEEELRLSRVDG